MQEKFIDLLNQIGINEDYLDYFINSYVEKVIINRSNKKFHFILKIDNLLPPNVYSDLLTSLEDSFTSGIKLTINYNNYDNDIISEYLNNIIKDYAQKEMRYNVFIDREISIENNIITYTAYNQIEELNLKNIEKDIVKKLEEYNIKGFKININLSLEENKEILESIEKDKIVNLPKDYSPTKTTTKPVEKTYYRTKKSREVTQIKDLLYETENINVEVQVFGIDIFEAKSGYKIFTLKITDLSDSMYAKIFTKEEEEFKKLKETLKKGNWYSMYGRVKEDNFSNNELVFMTRLKDIIPIDAKLEFVRTDRSTDKRVELHAHTMMSQMDGVIDEIKLIKTAIKWGHSAIAITDHDGCQAFPHIFNEVTSYNKKILSPYKDKLKELKEKKNEKIANNEIPAANLIEEEIKKVEQEMKEAKTFKAIYGTELEMSDDTLDIVTNPTDDDLYSSTYVIFDTETTGFNPGLHDTMIEIGAVKMKDGAVLDTFDELINPGVLIDSEITNLTGITNNMVKDSPNEEEVTKKFKEWIGDLPLVAHNAKFDKNMLESAYQKYNLGELKNTILDTMIISQIINKDLKRHSLSALTKNYGITFEESDGSSSSHHHRADYDSEFTGYVFFKMLKQLDKEKIKTFKDLYNLPTEQEINIWNREKKNSKDHGN